MKARLLRVLFSTVFFVLVICSVPVWLTVREVQRQQRNQAFLVAIEANDVPRILSLLDAGADLHTRKAEKKPLDFWEVLRQMIWRPRSKPATEEAPDRLPPTALEQIYWDEPVKEEPEDRTTSPAKSGSQPESDLPAGAETRAHIVKALEAKRQRAELKAILKRLANGTYGDLAALAASDGILVVRHHLDKERTERLASPYHEPPAPPRKKGYIGTPPLKLNGLQGVIYQDEEVMFAPDELHGDPFQRIFSYFKPLIAESLEESHFTTISLDLIPAGTFYPHHVGPAAQDAFISHWCVYFVQQNDQWRIWKLEVPSDEDE